jgi:PIN domain nuclease of toxin-antitoxin system
VKLLLDTHVWLWWNTEPERIESNARVQISDPGNDVFLSAASVWEMAIKSRLGKLPLPEPVATYVARRLSRDGIHAVPVTCEHAAAVEALALVHRDPFDRLLVIQARQEGMQLLTVDEQVLAYGAPTLDVRP